MMVLHDFVSKCIALHQDRSQPAWLYTDQNDTTRLEHGDRSDLESDVLAMTLLKSSTDPTSHVFIMPPELCVAICLNQAGRSLLLSEILSLDDIDLTARQVGDPSHGVGIPGTGDVNVRRSTDNASDSIKGKGKVATMGVASRSGSQPQHIDIKVLSEDDVPLQRRRKVSHGSGPTHGGPLVTELQDLKVDAMS
jgi:hypothetical protein